MNAPENFLENLKSKVVKFNLNGKIVEANEGETILEVSEREGIDVPRLCYKKGYRGDGN